MSLREEAKEESGPQIVSAEETKLDADSATEIPKEDKEEEKAPSSDLEADKQ